MTTTFSVVLDVTGALAPPDRCPTCSARLDPVPRDAGLDFGCRACGSRWRVELGRVRRVTRPCSRS